MQNIISRTVTGLVDQAQLVAPALTTHAATLGITRVTPAGLNTKITNLTGSRDTHHGAKVVRSEKRAALRGLLKDARQFATTARDVLKPFLGTKPSDAWAVAGFVGKLSIPTSRAGLLALMQQLKAYFTANPTHENAALNVSADRANTFASDITSTAALVQQKVAAVDTAKADRDAKFELLRQDLQAVLGELHVVLDPLSPIWSEFGFKKPGAQHIPDVPQNVVVLLTGPTSASIKWDAAARAGHYRVWKKVAGVDEEFVAVGSPADLDFTIEGLPGNATIQVAVSAVNNGGESAKSEAVTVVTS